MQKWCKPRRSHISVVVDVHVGRASKLIVLVLESRVLVRQLDALLSHGLAHRLVLLQRDPGEEEGSKTIKSSHARILKLEIGNTDSLLDDSLCKHGADQNSNETLHDPSCAHSFPGWIRLSSDLNRLYISLCGPISARLLSKFQSYQLRQGDPQSGFLQLHSLFVHVTLYAAQTWTKKRPN